VKSFLSKLSNKSAQGASREALREGTRPDWRRQHPSSLEELKEQVDRLHELAVLTLFLHSAGTMEEMVSLFMERSPRATGAIVTYPILLDRRRDLLHAALLANIEDAGIEQASIAANENLVDLEFPLPVRSWRRSAMEGGEVLLSDNLRDALGDVIGKEACDKIRHDLGVTKVATVPLVMEGESFGLCVFMFADVEPDVELLELVAGHCTLAIKELMAGEETTRFGGIDPVTWVHSRGYFLEALESEVVRARRYSRGLSMVLFDIDAFGQFNEAFGHTLGDRLLRLIGMTLSGTAVLPELVARFGGDEFAVLLPEADRTAAVELTAAIVEKVSALSVFDSEVEDKQDISVSAAIVSYPEDGTTREELLAAAEIALEQAKEERRAERAPARELSAVQQLRLAGRRRGA